MALSTLIQNSWYIVFRIFVIFCNSGLSVLVIYVFIYPFFYLFKR